jgi:hypothetical protein
MKTLILTALLAVAVLAVPAVGTASQPADVRITDLTPRTAVAAAPIGDIALLGRGADKLDGFEFVLPTGVISHDWVAADPFAR